MKDHEQVRVDWRPRAACLGMPHEMFFPRRGQSTWRAKRVCEDCPVIKDCLEEAIIRREPAGIRGAKSTRERQSIIKQRAEDGIDVTPMSKKSWRPTRN